MRVLVTGASGLLGLNVALEAAREHTVYGLVNSHPLKTDAFNVLQADLREPGAIERVLDQSQPDWVIHCAALVFVDVCEEYPEQARQLNVEVPALLAAHVARGGARLLHVSTDAVFDGQTGGYTETDAPNPLGVYARSKLDGENAVLSADPGAIVARVNLFGWSLGGTRSLGEFFYYNLKAGKPLRGFTDVFFCPLLATDAGSIFLQMLDMGLSGVYHTLASDTLSKYDFGVRIARRFGLNPDLIAPGSVRDAGLKAVRSPNLTLRTDKLAVALGHAPPTVDEGIERLFEQRQRGYPDMLKAMSAGD